MKRRLVCTLLFVLASHGAGAQGIDAQTQALAQSRVRSGAIPALVIGTIVGKQVQVQGFGALSRQDARQPDANTVFELGSVTKTFTALLLADAVARGQIKLDDPVAKLLPDYTIPRFGQQSITLLDLATQSSGLPRLPDNLLPAHPENPYADYSIDQLKSFLGRFQLARAPGASYEYSNLGFGLLGNALSAQAGKDYASLVADRITTPLGMHDTAIALSPAMQARLAPPHIQAGQLAANWDLPTLAGAGALRSTTHDMLLYLQAHMQAQTTSTPLGLRVVQQSLRGTTTPGQQIGLAWHIQSRQGKNLVWHSGMTGGYASFIGFTADGERGVVVLANASSIVDDLGMGVLLPEAAGQASGAPPMSAAALAPYAGTYQLAPGFVLTVTVAEQGLTAQATGQAPAALYPRAKDEFFYKVVDASLQFERAADGKVIAVVLHQGGRAMPAPRVEKPPVAAAPVRPVEIKLAAQELAQFAGTYALSPAFKLVVSVNEGQLFIQATGQGRSEVYPSARDEVFSKVVDAQISFKRDANGAVNALVLHQHGRDMPAPRSSD